MPAFRLKQETLEQILRSRKVLSHEVVPLVEELMERRKQWDNGDYLTDYDGLIIKVPAYQLAQKHAPWGSTSILNMEVNVPYVMNVASYWPTMVCYKYKEKGT